MRKFFRNITIAAMALSAAVSCVDDRNNFMVDDSLGFSIASGENLIELYSFEGKYDFSIIKSGKGFSGAKATVEPSNAYLMEYNEANRTSYVPLPKDCYSLSTNEVTFSEKEVSEKVTVTWDKDAVNAVLAEEPDCDYVIPIRVTSKDLDVNESRKLLVLSISKPVIDFKKPEHETLAVLAEVRESTESIPMKMTTGYPEDITVKFSIDNSLVDEYIERKRLDGYTAVPEEYEGFVSLPQDNKLVIPAGTTEFSLDLSMNTAVFFGEDASSLPELFEGYVLPVRATEVSTEGVVLGEDIVYVLITSTYVLPLEFTELWGLYTGASGASWFTSSIIGGLSGGDRNVAIDDKYAYVPQCEVGGNYVVYAFGIEDGSVKKIASPSNPLKGDGFTSCTAKIMKNGVESINDGKDFLVVTNMTQGASSFVLYAYVNGIDKEPQTVTLEGWSDGRYGDRISIYGNLKDGVRIIAKDMKGEAIYAFGFKGSIPNSVSAEIITVEGTSTAWEAGAFYQHPDDKNVAVMTTSAHSYLLKSSDGTNFSIDNWSADFAGLANCLDVSYFTINGIEYVAYVKLEASNNQGRVVILENKDGVDGLKTTLEKSDDEKAPIAFTTPTQDAVDFDVASSVATGNSAMGLSVYETENAVYMAALQQSGGLSVYKLNK